MTAFQLPFYGLFFLAAMAGSISAQAQPVASNNIDPVSQQGDQVNRTNLIGDAKKNISSISNPIAGANTVVAPSLEISNLFDAQRKVWPDRVPPPPPPPPPTPPAPVSDADLQLYGIVIVGATKRATVKVGPRFASSAPNGRSFSNLVEGQTLGEFTVSHISSTYVTLSAPGGQQQVHFTKKTDRSVGNTVAAVPRNAEPVQAATEATVSDSSQKNNSAQPPTGSELVSAPEGGNAMASRNLATPAAAPTSAAKEGPPPPPVDIQNSLAAAIAAARANASNRPPGGNSLNPFMQTP